MQQKQLMIVGVIVLGIIGVGLYFLVPMPTLPTDENVAELSSAPKSLRGLLGMSGAQKCTVASSVATAESTGVVYIAGGKVRGDFVSAVAVGETQVTSHMITDGKISHVWMDGMPQGYTMSAEMTDADSAGAQNDRAPETVSLDQEASYKCESWSVDATQFELPKDIEFVDMAEMMKGIPMMGASGGGVPAMDDGAVPTIPSTSGGMGDMKAMQCAACEQAGESRAECLAALGCN